MHSIARAHRVCAGLYFHVVLSTKGRAPLLHDHLADRLRTHVGATVRACDGEMIVAGGAADHLHLLLHVGPRIGLSRLVERVKHDAMQWAGIAFPESVPLAWDEGYIAFTVRGADQQRIAEVIRQQHERHQRMTLQEELHRLSRNVLV